MYIHHTGCPSFIHSMSHLHVHVCNLLLAVLWRVICGVLVSNGVINCRSEEEEWREEWREGRRKGGKRSEVCLGRREECLGSVFP